MSTFLMLSPLQLAHVADIGRDSAYKALEAGTFPSIRVGRQWRIPAHRLAAVLGCTVDDIVAALAEQESEGPAPPEEPTPQDLERQPGESESPCQA